jgi:hypothetical protein
VVQGEEGGWAHGGLVGREGRGRWHAAMPRAIAFPAPRAYV